VLPEGLVLAYPAMVMAPSASFSRLIFSNDPILNYQCMRMVIDCYVGKLEHLAKVRQNMTQNVTQNVTQTYKMQCY
jgi:hypothetical protein